MASYDLAIDFGNSNIKVATIEKGKRRKIDVVSMNTEHGADKYIENIVFYKKDEVLLGSSAIKEAVKENREDEVIYGIKQQLESREWKYFAVDQQKEKTEIDVVSDILSVIVEKVKKKKSSDVLEQCIMTVPVNFSEYQKEKIRKACKNIGLPLKAMISEPVAAGLQGVIEDVDDLDDGEEFNAFVFDCGGGTLDIALLNIIKYDDEVEVKVLGSVGMNYGGIYLNQLILSHCVVPKLSNPEILKEKKYLSKLLPEIEKAKISCLGESEEDEYGIVLTDSDYGQQIKSQTITVTKEELEEIVIQSNVKQYMYEMFDYLLENEGMEKEDIQKVVLTGGTSQIISIQNMIREYVNDDDDIFDMDDIDQDEILYFVVTGAAEYLKILSDENTKITIENKIPYELFAIDSKNRVVNLLSRNTSFEQDTPLKRFKSISVEEKEEESILYQRFQTFGNDRNLEVAIGKIKCDKKKFDSYIYYNFFVDKYGKILCRFYNDTTLIEESEISLEE